MDYKLFEEYTTLQALLKELNIIQSGGAAKTFLANNIVLFNGGHEERRGKKLRLGDKVEIPADDITINIVAPSEEDRKQYLEEKEEKERVANLVKKLNKENKKAKSAASKQKYQKNLPKKPVRFPGT